MLNVITSVRELLHICVCVGEAVTSGNDSYAHKSVHPNKSYHLSISYDGPLARVDKSAFIVHWVKI